MSEYLRPGSKIGIIGGGQLGRMLAIAAGRLGYDCIVLDPDENCPAKQFCNQQIVGEYDDKPSLEALNRMCSVVTYEFENVPAHTLYSVFNEGELYPPIPALEISQDRLKEKKFLNSLSIGTARFVDVNQQNFAQSLSDVGGQGILKTRRLGYDGRGQLSVELSNLSEAEKLLGESSADTFILEGRVAFDREISVIAARGIDGEVRCFDPAENVHADGILRTSRVPTRLAQTVLDTAVLHCENILSALNYVGVMGIEFFVEKDGQLLVNEFAPRVHNSGHWSEVACVISQFEQHIRAVAGLPLGNPFRHSPCIMENLIGNEIEKAGEFAKTDGALVHLYGKKEVRNGRKMGHVTRIL